MTNSPKPFVVHESGGYLHGTRADLAPGDLLLTGHESNYEKGRRLKHVYVTRTLDAAAWGAEMAVGDGPPRIYLVEPQGEIEDDPNVTDKKLPGNPTCSYRTEAPVLIVGELTDWVGHTPDQLQAMRSGLAELRRRRLDVIYD
ncbi:NAD(+)--rifampin ADP-ribosyltransferase, partial [Williamsia sp.]|uniref:NAD(+)--rifampin ADP-ribosyltransferase n=1 Tax=Williamsia sp. TaxID=1872085 RepID=UPI001A2F63F2